MGVDYRLSNGKKYTFNRIGDNFKEILSGFPAHYYPWHFVEKKLVRNKAMDLFSYLYMHTHRDFKDIFNTLKADILVCSHPWSSLSMNKKSNQLFIYDAHNCEYLLMDQILGNHILKPLILKKVKYVEADACKKADIITVCSESEKKSFIDIYNIEPSRLHIIPNGSYVKPTITQQDKQNAKKELGIDTDKKVLIFIGAHYKPNIDAARFILEMLVPELPEYVFLMVGSVAQEFRGSIVPSNIKFLGQVPDERLSLALKAADIALNPMFMGSGVNIKMLDYMSFGLPVITTECGARGLNVDGKQPMVICSIAKFVDNIKNLGNDDELYKKMSLDARSLVSEKYDWKTISNKLEEIILENLKYNVHIISNTKPKNISIKGLATTMQLQLFKTRHISKVSPNGEDWEQHWHGYFQMKRVRSPQKRIMDAKMHNDTMRPTDVMSEYEAEKQIFLNVISNIKKDCITMFELGAGRGDFCLSLAGVIDHGIIPVSAKSYRCLALEPEPTHFEWTKEHFERQGIKGIAVPGAIQGHDGYCLFELGDVYTYGQSVSRNGNIRVPCYTIDTLMKKHDFSHLDILHMDVQGAEYDALQGATNQLDQGKIDYIIIGTHGPDMNKYLKGLLEVRYNIIVDISPKTPSLETPLGKVSFPVDGIMMCERKDLNNLDPQ